MRELIPNISSNEPFLSFVAKTMNKFIGERDWVSQEVAHMLLHLPLQHGSRTVMTLDCRTPIEQSTAINLEDEEGDKGGRQQQSRLEKYISRIDDQEDVTLFGYVT